MADGTGDTPAAPVGWVRRLWNPYLRAHRRDVVLGFGAAVTGLAITALLPLVQKVVIDDVILERRRPLAPWLTILVVAGVARFGLAHVRRYVGGRFGLGVQYDLRNDIFARLQRLDFARHDQSHTGQLVSRATGDVMLVQGLLALLPLTTGNVVLLVLSLVIMGFLSPLLTVVALVAVPVLLLLAARLRDTVFPAAWDAQQKAGEVAGVVDEAVSGVRVVKAFGQESRELERLTEASRELFGSRVRSSRIEARYAAAFQVVPALSQVAVLALGGWLALQGRISVGTLLAFSTYLVQLVGPVRMLTALLVVGQQARAGAERIFDILDANPDVDEKPGATVLGELAGEVVFDDVRFGYQRSRPVLSGFSLRVAPGETVALVGASGSGKSTVAMLLPRFYDVQSGAVRVDGIDVRDATFDSLRRQVGVVFEETFLFSDTVRSNIAYGRPEATEDEVVAAARAAEAHRFITALPDGYDTVLGERGLTLSGGQRQRVALARALLTDPRVLVLDDATSAIDSRVEEEIHATLRRLLEGRTTLLVAHRRSTLRLADRIAVVDGGAVVDVGTHAELLARSRMYRRLLAGPGETCEGDDEEAGGAGTGDTGPRTDAGPWTDTGTDGRPGTDSRPDAGTAPDGITASAWQPLPGPPPRPRFAAPPMGATVTGAGHGMSFGGPQASDFMARMGPTPELMARVDALPPATARPSSRALDAVTAAEAVPGRTASGFSLRRLLSPYRRQLGVGLVLVVADTAAAVAGPTIVRWGIDGGVVGRSESALWAASAVFLAVVLANWLNVYAEQRYTRRTAEELLFGLRVGIFRHLQGLGLDYYDRELPGRIMTRMTTDVESLSTLLQNGLINAMVSLLSFGGVAILMVSMNVPLSLATLAVLVPLAAATVWFRKVSAAAYDTARDRIATVNANLQENLSGVRVAQAYGREKRNLGEFRRVSRDYFNARLSAQRLVATYFPLVELLSEVAAAVVLWVGAGQISAGRLTPGELIAFLLYLSQLFSPIQQLSQVFDTYQQARASMNQVAGLLATPSSTPRPEHPVAIGRLRGSLRLDDVRFRYPGADTDALAGLALDVRPGERVALVGETGAGKSTIVKLVARFYDPTEGAVVVDGVALTDIDLDAYRRQLGYVPQEVFLFSGTIRDNIAYGRAGVSDAEVEAAARAVGAHDLVAGLPGGYLHPVTERGRSLSAGQRQLIALARAHLVDPAILLLDEATSNLDLVTEARVTRAMQVLSQGRTTLLVAHRLATAAGADRVVVVDGGRIVEQGSHGELLAQGGRYADMWKAFEVEPQAV